ncbi:MAG: redox-sensing transcriptional repressor Rex [Planctomycetes bacterium]|nr:redox-sensing transcriptional repressor Rex [Planctomycetota bacterium]
MGNSNPGSDQKSSSTGETKRKLSSAIVRRLPRYLLYLQRLKSCGVKWISSQEIANFLELTPSTVRQDLSVLKITGFAKRGYEVDRLERSLYNVMGTESASEIAIIGAGHLGTAFAAQEEFAKRGLHIFSLYDQNPNIIGQYVSSVEIKDIKDLPEDIKKHNIQLGVIAVPPTAAQEVCDLMVEAGIKGILNLALIHISTPDHVEVKDARLVIALQELVYRVTTKESD